MYHSVKRKVGTKAEGNAEFNDYKGRLENLAVSLTASHTALKQSDEAWKVLVHSQKTFAEEFSNKYPDKDTTREFSKKSAESSQAVAKEFILKTDEGTATHWKLDAIPQAYIGEIREIEATYKDLTKSNTDLELYKKKVQDLQKPRKKDLTDKEKSKVERNIKKLEENQQKHDELLDKTVERMKEVYAKRQVAMKSAYVAFWLSQMRAFEMVDKSIAITREFVGASVDSLLDVNMAKLTEEQINQIVNVSLPAESVPAGKVGEPPSSPIEKETPAATAV
eukprot:Plantae.Rhodophyta-Hildenbrandia_rubra.ctg26226.p1 GENE.Plantae.Rhodophyta-Hildenbrandia_rubra.ctg26226~~Plantae.Rhodophyta-Hildenbrandia_rubra.ctg26226.p1  ORF type:complete len:279 (+),score=69.43 Plantae.Rhodophyta-Hildenbrandia_rubra.ctg26226:1255-2091(+)